MFPNDNAFLTEQYKTYRLQLVQLTDGDISDFRRRRHFSGSLRYPEISAELVERLLHIKVGHVEYSELEKAIKPFYTTKSVRLDVYLKDEDKQDYRC